MEGVILSLFDCTKIGYHIKKARRYKTAQLGFGFTRKMLAAAIDEPLRIIYLLEAGKYYPDYEHVKKIAKVCGVSVKYLVGENFSSMDDYFKAVRRATKKYAISKDDKKCIKTDPY